MTVMMTAALGGAFALLVGVFAVLIWDLLEERSPGRRWLRVVVVVVLAPVCALGAAMVSAVAGLALVTTLDLEEVPTGPSEQPARTESAQPETTSVETPSPAARPYPSASPSSSATPSPSASPSPSSSATSSPSASPSP